MVILPFALRAFIRYAERGDHFVYHVGHIAQDRWIGTYGPAITSLTFEPDGEVSAIADAAYEQYMLGRVSLVQRKIGENTYEYIAQRR
jgi:hypothetical protein